jgi:hypothetical protein
MKALVCILVAARNALIRFLGVAVVGLGFWEWISSARDAARAAERANERHRRKTARARPIIEAPGGSQSDWRAGVVIPW